MSSPVEGPSMAACPVALFYYYLELPGRQATRLGCPRHREKVWPSTSALNLKLTTCHWFCLQNEFFLKQFQYLQVSFLQCALRMDSSGQNSIFKRQNRELDPFWPWWLVPAINRTARHTSQANMGSRDIHKTRFVFFFQDLLFSAVQAHLNLASCQVQLLS